ncbi:MAG TPA: polyphosphate kinase 1, partial [Lachnospiraceae bacterium]|nr:polyphosphate kinase 1 [Lachnospiraceae bacterium]
MESEKVEVVDYTKPEYYTNREMSWLSFDERILSEARDRNIPLFERLKFMSITSSNLDEFYMVRVASLKDMVHSEYTKPDFAGMTPKDQLKNISEKTHKMVELQYRTYNRSILQGLKNVKLRILDYEDKLTQEQTRFIDDYYDEVVYPVLTPMALDSSRPFPLIRNKSLNIGALISKNGKKKKANFATIQVPSVLSRYLEIPRDEDGNRCIVLLENVIKRNIDKIFQGFQVICAYPYRIMRNAELGIDEDDASDLLLEIEKSLKKRQWGEVIRLEADAGMDKDMLAILKKELQIREEDVFMINGPVDLTFLMSMYGLKGFDDQKVEDYTPVDVPCLRNKDDIFTNIRKKDIFLHHPYYSFDPVVDFVTSASVDPDVLAIKQTLYRVSGNSPIVAALERAAMNGKMVTVLVELKARFDEENNIGWARELERAGCHVIYGLVGLKTHSKITLIVRREDDGIRRYVHLGTGNYNDKTAKLYTDCGIL